MNKKNEIEKAIDNLGTLANCCRFSGDCGTCEICYKAVPMAREALEKQITGDWIPITKEPPKTGTECLVTNEAGEINHVYYAGDKKYHFTAYYNRIMQGKVIAWMPMMKSYKEK
jgi:hypothetical protein